MPAELKQLPVPIAFGGIPPLRLGVYGEGGVGKTTLALSFPKPLFIDTDSGLEGDAVAEAIVGAEQWSPVKWQDLNALYAWVKLNIEEKDYKTIVIDSMDTLCTFIRIEALNVATQGRAADRTETQLVAAEKADYGKVATAMSVFLTKLKVLSREKGIHIVITSAVREPDPEKGQLKRTFDCQQAVEKMLIHWCNIYGELEAVEADGVEGRILWTRVSDPRRKNKTRFSALRPGVKNPTFDRMVDLLKGDSE